MSNRPLIVGIGGTLRHGSSSEIAMRRVLRHAESLGAECRTFAGTDLVMPMYEPDQSARSPAARDLVEALRIADGIVISSPAYHGSVSGLFKNAVDYTEDLRNDKRAYLTGRAVACIASAGGAQAGVSTLAALRSIVHALRGWPTPLGVFVDTRTPAFDLSGECLDAGLRGQMRTMAEEVIEFAARRRGRTEPVMLSTQ